MTRIRPRGVQSDRLSDWEDRLTAYIGERFDAPHAWGSNDCVMFGAGAVEAQTGTDPAAEFRGEYRSFAGAQRVLSKHGDGTVQGMIDPLFRRIAPAFAQRGDLVLAEGSLGVVVGNEALFPGEEGARAGLVRLPRTAWTRAWKV